MINEENTEDKIAIEVTIEKRQDSMSSSGKEVEKIVSSMVPEQMVTSTEPEPDPALAKSPNY